MANYRPTIGIDLDGTLISCREKQLFSLHKSLQLLRIKYDAYDEFWKLKTNGLTTAHALMSTGIDRSVAQNAAEIWIENVETWECLEKDRIVPGAFDVLASLSHRADLLLLSARQNAAMFERQIVTLGLKPYFKFVMTVLTGSDAANAKAFYLMEHGARCYIGDTESDAAAAAKANIAIYLVATGQRSLEFLQSRVRCDNGVKIFGSLQLATSEVIKDLDV